MGKRKATGKGDRLVYSEFGTPDLPEEAAIEDRPPAEQKIIVQASRKGRGGKTVTVAEGFQHAPTTLKTLLKQLKAQCGAGGAVKEMTIEIQGDMTRKVADVLIGLGYKVKISGG